MANEQQQTQPQVAIPLPKGKKNAVQIGCICMMLSVAMYGRRCEIFSVNLNLL